MERLLEETSHPKTPDKRLRGTFLDARSSSLENLRVSLLRALRVLRRRQKRNECERACSMAYLIDQPSGLPALPGASQNGWFDFALYLKKKEKA